MIAVDSSVWIAFLRGTVNPRTDRLKELIGREEIAVPDVVLTEVLQGIDTEHRARRIEHILSAFAVINTGGRDAGVAAGRNYRVLRRQGVTVRKTVDTMIATACIRGGHTLLHDDRDFHAFEQHLGLRTLR